MKFRSVPTLVESELGCSIMLQKAGGAVKGKVAAGNNSRYLLLNSKVWRSSLQAVYILSGARTPIGKFGGSLASLTAADMGVVAAKAAMERAGILPNQVQETIFGNARQAGGGP